MNNNCLKKSLLDYISANSLNLVSYKELNINNLSTSDFKIVLRSNKQVLHTIILNYHLKIKKISTDINGSNLTVYTFSSVAMIIDFCNKNAV